MFLFIAIQGVNAIFKTFDYKYAEELKLCYIGLNLLERIIKYENIRNDKDFDRRVGNYERVITRMYSHIKLKHSDIISKVQNK